MKAFSLRGKSALVTGSSKGIGLAIALGLRQAGARVIFHGGHSRPAEIPADADFVKGDLLKADGPTTVWRKAIRALPDISLLVCNAGGFFDTPFLEMTRERWDKTIQLNLTATYFMAQQFARRLASQSRPGAMIIVSSTNGSQAEMDSTAYDTSKGGLVMLTRSLSLSLADHGIRVNGIAPGLIRTPLTSPWLDQRADLKQHYEKKIPLGSIGSAEDCTGAAVFLCSPAARYITGHVLTVDGGLTVGQIGRL